MILIKVVQGKSYILLLFSLFVLMIISKHYPTYTVSLHLYLKSFFFLHISHKIRFKSKIHSRKDENNSKDEGKQEESKLDTRGDEERRTSEDEEERVEFFCSSKRTVCCFGEGY